MWGVVSAFAGDGWAGCSEVRQLGSLRMPPTCSNAFVHVIFVASRLHLLTLPSLRQWRWGRDGPGAGRDRQ
eukprot:768705-Hanusia_phi.AAC.8